MPRPYRIAKDTGMIEYDDSIHIEGKCPKCNKIHTGAFDVCDDCIGEQQRRHEEQESAYYDHLEDLAQDESDEVHSIFSGSPDWVQLED